MGETVAAPAGDSHGEVVDAIGDAGGILPSVANQVSDAPAHPAMTCREAPKKTGCHHCYYAATDNALDRKIAEAKRLSRGGKAGNGPTGNFAALRVDLG